MARLLKLCALPLPLPFGAVDTNRRSLIYVGNLADAAAHVLEPPDPHGPTAGGAPAGTYLVCDGEDLSTAELVRRLRQAMGRPPRLVPLPVRLLTVAGRLARRRGEVDRLTGSLAIDGTAFRTATGWSPPFSVDEGLAETVRWFRGTAG